MYIGYWKPAQHYNRSDITYSKIKQQYYICSQKHTSCNLTSPTNECIYWLNINQTFLSKYIEWHNKDTFKTDNNNTHTHKDKDKLKFKRKRDVESDTDIHTKRIKKIEDTLQKYRKDKTNNVDNLRERLLLLDIDTSTKSHLIEKLDSTKLLRDSDFVKNMMWLRTVDKIPFGIYKPLINSKRKADIKSFLNHVKTTMDKYILGLDDVKQEILEFVSRKITNPNGKGEVLALCGDAGTGKSKILSSLAEALDFQLHQINCGGLNDVSILTGHSETYVGAKPGKIVDILQNSDYMNPIIYLDELDKMSERKSDELNGVFTHLLDEDQNHKFQDNYLANINLDLSKVLFVISFNDISKINDIVSDRLKIIHINKPTHDQKVNICSEKLLPDILKNINSKLTVNIDTELISYIISTKCTNEVGVRGVKKIFEKILNRLNYDILIGHIKQTNIHYISKSYIDTVLKDPNQDLSYLSMYS